MIVLKSNEATSLSFEMMIEGAAQNIEKVNLVLETDKGFDIQIPAKFENGTVSSIVPVLDSILESGEYQLTLEVSIDGKVYSPLQESVKIETPVQVKAKLAESVEVVPEKKEEPIFKPMSLSQAILADAKSLKQ